MTTSTVLQHQTTAYHYGSLSKKSPNMFAGWQERHVILSVDMFLYYNPGKSEGGEAGPMKGFILLKDILDVQSVEEDQLSIVVKGREFLWKAQDPASRDKWMSRLKYAVAVISSSDPQIISVLTIDKLWSDKLLGISLKERRVVAISWEHAKTQGWKLGDVCIKVDNAHVVDQADAVEKLSAARSQTLPFKVVIMRYDDSQMEGALEAPQEEVAKERDHVAEQAAEPTEGEDKQIDPLAGQNEM